MHSTDLQATVTNAKDFKAAELKANHTQAINLPLRLHQWNLGTEYIQNLSSQNYLSLLVTPEDIASNNTESNHKQTLTNNISPVTIINNESLAAIFPFELEESISMPLFSEVALEEKPITAMYTDVKVDGHSIKLILNSGSEGSIITQLMDQLGH
ncbi:hypothetical protein G9A89_011374 [Geosiphon pyriformis]|nr:hypothetical protein G9A89_011374 [Geosiphon pyriformis]